jgi:hypothetical protein
MVIMIIKTVLIFVLYMVTYYAYGLLFNKITRRKSPDLTITMVAGMFLYATVFMAYAIPLKYWLMPLHITAWIWLGVWAVSVAVFFLICRRDAKKPLMSALGYIREHRLNSLLLLAVILAQVIFVEVYGRWSGSNNPSEYVAYVTTAIFTDQVGTTDPRTAVALKTFEPRTFTQTVLDHSAVVSKIFNLHPLMEIRSVIPAVFLIMGSLIIYLTARAIFKDSDAKQWLFFAGYMLVLCVTSNSTVLQGFYYFWRNYEGKNAYAAIVIPLMFYVLWKLYENPRDNVSLTLGLLCVIGSFHYTGIALFSIPMTVLGLIPGMFSKKNWAWMLRDMVVLVIPCILYAVYYMGVLKGYITLLV